MASNGRSHSRIGFLYRQQTLRLDPNRVQATALARACGTRRWAYNRALAEQITAYRTTGSFLSPAAQMRAIVELKHTAEFAWLNEVSKCAPVAAIQDLHQALMTFLLKRGGPQGRRVGFPKFRKKHRGREIVRLHGCIAISGGTVGLPRIGRVRIMPREPRLEGRIVSVTCFCEAGRWYVSLRLEIPSPASIPEPPHGEMVGLDLGIRTLAVDSNGRSYNGARALLRGQRRLARANRSLSRKQRGSRNRLKAVRRLQRVHARVRHQRMDHLHKLTTHLARTKRAVVIEDLAVGGMIRSRRFSRSLADQSFGTVRRQLEYKCRASGSRLLVAPRFFASTRRCSGCGSTWEGITLSDREYICPNPACGLRLDRDHNAALNLRWWGQQTVSEVTAGRAETINACGARVSPGRTQRAIRSSASGRAQAVKQEPSAAGLPVDQSRT